MFAFVAVTAFGQTPLTVRAGDPAPALTWTKIVRSGTGLGGPQSLFGQTTVLSFLPPVSHNEQAVERWNKLVDQFADKRVNFVWIASEEESTVEPFLNTHPIKGWLVLDPKEESYKAYGIEGGAGVLIDPHGVISGFTFMAPEEEQIQAVLDGRAIAIQGDPAEAQMDALFSGKAVRLEAEPHRMPPLPEKPNVPPSEEVRISPSQTHGTIASSGPDHWMQRGFDLKTVIAMVSQTDPSRVEMPESFDNLAKYDFVLVPPQEEDQETMFRQVREGIEKYFHVAITPEVRNRDVYVMTALEGKTPAAKSEDERFGGTFVSSSGFTRTIAVPHGASRKEVEEALAKQEEADEELANLASISAFSSTMKDFREGLERGLKRPVIDETKLIGSYDLAVKGEAQSTEEFLGLLRDQLGLVLTPAQRSIDVVVVRPAP